MLKLTKSLKIEGNFYYFGKLINEVDVFENTDKCTKEIYVSFMLDNELKTGFLTKENTLFDTSIVLTCSREIEIFLMNKNFIIKNYDHFIDVEYLNEPYNDSTKSIVTSTAKSFTLNVTIKEIKNLTEATTKLQLINSQSNNKSQLVTQVSPIKLKSAEIEFKNLSKNELNTFISNFFNDTQDIIFWSIILINNFAYWFYFIFKQKNTQKINTNDVFTTNSYENQEMVILSDGSDYKTIGFVEEAFRVISEKNGQNQLAEPYKSEKNSNLSKNVSENSEKPIKKY